MRKLFALLALLVMVLAVAGLASAQTTSHRTIGSDSGVEGSSGYWGFVDSTWESSSYPSAEYTTLNAPTGKRFQLFEIWTTRLTGVASASETFTVNFWRSATDSSSICSQRTIRLHEKAQPLKFYVDAYKASFQNIGTADSVVARGYYK